jgi:hypothetical protein
MPSSFARRPVPKPVSVSLFGFSSDTAMIDSA